MFDKELATLQELFSRGLFEPSFYSSKLASPDMLESYEKFQEVPFTYKHEIRNSPIMERTTTQFGDIYGFFSSSGTTGDKTYYVYSKKDKEVHEHFVSSYLSGLGIKASDVGGIMAPIDTGVMAHTMMWEFTTMGASYVNCPEPSPQGMASVIQSVPVTVIATRPSVATAPIFAPELSDVFRNSTVSKLILGGGFLSNERRKLIEDIWGAQCYNLFGMSEMFGPMAAECHCRDGLHYLSDYLMIEIVDPDTGKPTAPGDPGVAVYTSLWEKGFPLLRYWTDDYMVVDETPCMCGSHNPRLKYLGRLADCYHVGDKYVFPEQIENILFENGLFGEYRVDFSEKGVEVTAETPTMHSSSDLSCSEKVSNSLVELLERNDLTVKILPIGSLPFNAHGRRFSCQ